jgi:hypothetical protein
MMYFEIALKGRRASGPDNLLTTCPDDICPCSGVANLYKCITATPATQDMFEYVLNHSKQ